MKPLLLSLGLLVVVAAAANAQDRNGYLPEWRGAILSGSQRLMLFSLMKANPTGSLEAQMQVAKRLGFFHGPGDGLVVEDPNLAIEPIVKYDENVNNGVSDGSLILGNYILTPTKDSLAQAALVGGARLAMGVPVLYDRGSTLNFGLSGSITHSPAVDYTRTWLHVSTCADHYLSDWSWLILCAGYQYENEREVDNTEKGPFGTIGLRKIFSSSRGSHEITATLSKERMIDYDKLSVSGSLLSAIAGVGAVNFVAGLGEIVPGENTMKWEVGASLTRPVFGETTTFALGAEAKEGDNFFGVARKDRTYSLSVGRQMNELLWVDVGAKRRESTVDLFDENILTVDFSITGWTF